MPYIITTSYRETDLDGRIIDEAFLSRTAVATLEEARAAAFDAGAGEADFGGLDLSTEGGTIPLPDGTVIEVRRVDWRDMADATRRVYATGGEAEILAAFNAR